MEHPKAIYETAVVDTNIFLKLIDVRNIAYTITVTPEMMEELKDPQVKSFFASCPVPYAVREASRESLAAVMDAATMVGDVHVLSKADISLIALARDMAIELGDEKFLKTPKLTDLASMKKRARREKKKRGIPGNDFSPVIRDMMLKEKEEKLKEKEQETDGWKVAGECRNKGRNNRKRRNRRKRMEAEKLELMNNNNNNNEEEEERQEKQEEKEREKTEEKATKEKKKQTTTKDDPFAINGMDGQWITEETLQKEMDMVNKELVIVDKDNKNEEKKEEEEEEGKNNADNCEDKDQSEQENDRPKSILLTADIPMQNTAVALGLCVVVPKNCHGDVRDISNSIDDFIIIKECKANRICCKACYHVLNPEEVPNVCPVCGTEKMFARVWANINDKGEIYGITKNAIQKARLIDNKDRKIDWYHRPGLASLSGSDWFQQDFIGPTTIRHTSREFTLSSAQKKRFEHQSLDSSRVIVGEKIEKK